MNVPDRFSENTQIQNFMEAELFHANCRIRKLVSGSYALQYITCRQKKERHGKAVFVSSHYLIGGWAHALSLVCLLRKK